MNQVTLAPGASQVVPISTGAVNFAVQAALNLTVVATSTSNPTIQGAGSADLMIPVTQGMTAEFSPASQALSQPGMATFLLIVHNTGNTEDSYSATIIGVDGPVTATLVGLDGSPTDSISTFILPGLSTGAILLQAQLSAVGQGAVTVQVKSLTNTETATPVATAVVTSSPTPTTPTPTTPTTPTPTTPTTPFVTMISAGVVKKKVKHHRLTEILIGFSGALNATEAQELSNYRLVRSGKHHSFTAKNARVLKLKSAMYDAAGDMVSLIPRKRLVPRKSYELVVTGQPPAGLQDSLGRYIDGGRKGTSGSNAVAVLSRSGATIVATASGTTVGRALGIVAAVDRSLEAGDLILETRRRRFLREARHAAP
jgi:hypothetical protein